MIFVAGRSIKTWFFQWWKKRLSVLTLIASTVITRRCLRFPSTPLNKIVLRSNIQLQNYSRTLEFLDYTTAFASWVLPQERKGKTLEATFYFPCGDVEFDGTKSHRSLVVELEILIDWEWNLGFSCVDTWTNLLVCIRFNDRRRNHQEKTFIKEIVSNEKQKRNGSNEFLLD